MRLVTVHPAEGQTLRDLELGMRAVADPGTPVRLVSGRHGRSGVLVDAGLALRYLLLAEGVLEIVGETVGSDGQVELTATLADGAVVPLDEQPPAAPVAEPVAKPAKAAKAAPKAAKAAPKKPEEV